MAIGWDFHLHDTTYLTNYLYIATRYTIMSKLVNVLFVHLHITIRRVYNSKTRTFANELNLCSRFSKRRCTHKHCLILKKLLVYVNEISISNRWILRDCDDEFSYISRNESKFLLNRIRGILLFFFKKPNMIFCIVYFITIANLILKIPENSFDETGRVQLHTDYNWISRTNILYRIYWYD